MTVSEYIKSFMNKSELLLNEFEEVNYVDFYNEVFPSGSFQEHGKGVRTKTWTKKAR